MAFMLSISNLEINDKFGNGSVTKSLGGGHGNTGARLVKLNKKIMLQKETPKK